MIERVMLLDAVLDDRSQAWIGTGADKRRFFMRAVGAALPWQQFPRIRFGVGADATYRYFPDKLPVGIHPELGDRPVSLYLVNRPSPWDFRLFLLRHVALLEGALAPDDPPALPRAAGKGATCVPERGP